MSDEKGSKYEDIDFGKIDEENDWADVEYIGGMYIGSDETKGSGYLMFGNIDDEENPVLLQMTDEEFEKFMYMVQSLNR